MKSLRKYWRWGVVCTAVTLFLLLKLLTLEFHFGDPTAYWYMAQVVAKGILPYRDFFFADPPLLVLFYVPLLAVVGEYFLVLQFVPYVLELLTAVLLAVLLKKQEITYWWLAPLIYLGSFTITATSDYGTGMQLASLWLVTALLFLEKKRFFWTGVLLACAALTKLYMGAAVLGVVGYTLWLKDWRAVRQIILGGSVATGLLILPWLLLSGGAFFGDILLHQLSRPAGLNKATVLSFFVFREWVLLVGVAGLVWWRKQAVVSWILAAELLFFLVFQDLYYAYLGILILPLTALATSWSGVLQKNLHSFSQFHTHIRDAVTVLAVLWLVSGQAFYWTSTQHEGRFETTEQLVAALAEQPTELPLYGSHELVPLLALKTMRPIFENIIDSNGQTFASGAQDKRAISERAVEDGVLLLSRGQLHPVTGEVLSLHQAYFDDEIYNQHCVPLHEQPVTPQHASEYVVLSQCGRE